MDELALTRVAHSCVLLDFGGDAVLTDPWFSEKRGYYRGEPLGIALNNLPSLTGVIASYAHYGHYDMEAFASYPDKRVSFVVRRGTAEAAREAGFENVTELEP